MNEQETTPALPKRVFNDIRSLVASGASHAHALGALARIEAQEYKKSLKLRLILSVIAGFFLAIAYLLGMVALWDFLSFILGSWVNAALILAGVHLLLALMLLFWASRAKKSPAFSATLAELHEDFSLLEKKNESEGESENP